MRTCMALLSVALVAAAQDPLRYWAPANRDAHKTFEERLVTAVQPTSLSKYHDLLSSVPHRAGTAGDLAVVKALASTFRELGLEVEEQELWLYLARPVEASLELVSPVRRKLPVREKEVDGFSGDPRGSFGWNAFSGSGFVVGSVVYANYGTKQDYAKLEELGIDIAGKVVIARYGGNFRGYKARFAEAGGAIGLILYTDPADSGWGKGLPWPEGGYANGSYIQRGSILTLDYRGDPLTPFVPATRDAERLDPKEVAFPGIVVQPVGWDAAKEILGRMKGASVPEGWQGGLPFRYRLTGGEDLKVRVSVKQERKLTRTFNVTGTLRGAKFPEQFVVVGAHHDAWGFGAGDPAAGTILVLEAARCFAEAARAGMRPARSIVFAGWAAEEYGIMGSVEWVEAHRERLSRHCIAYLNLDVAAMGSNVRSSAAPLLKTVIDECVMAETGKKLERFGNLGGGSDHIGFYCHLAIPCAALGAGGSKGVSYHSLYDNLEWYRKVVGPEYKPARMLARIVNRFLARVSNADLLPLDPVRYGPDLREHLKALGERAVELKVEADLALLENEGTVHEMHAKCVLAQVLRVLDAGKLDGAALSHVNRQLLEMERSWLSDGLPSRPWYRSLYAAPDEDSGYAAWMLPGLRWAVEHRRTDALPDLLRDYRSTFLRMEMRLLRIDSLTRTR